jgi:hypothetical protein
MIAVSMIHGDVHRVCPFRASWRTIATALCVMMASVTGAFAQGTCDRYLDPPRQVRGKAAGPKSCLMQETEIRHDGRSFTRLDVGLDGTVEGYLAKVGDYKEYFSNSPDLVFQQTWGAREIFFAVAAYERDKGAAMTVVFPSDKSAWNGSVFVMVHGRGVSFKEGSLKPWNRNLDPAQPARDLDKYDLLLLSKGYAVVKTHRTSTENLGEIKATLEDGSTVDYIAFNDTAKYVLDFAAVGKKMIAERMGASPAHVYMYGHSAGARIGHALNYSPGLNVGRDGKRFFDGLLNDDPAAGTWYPVVMKDGKDVLLANPVDRAAFVPMIDVAHQMYNNIWPPKHPDWMSSSYLENKRNNARILRDKAVTNYRMYEVRSISHSGGENLRDGQKGAIDNLDLSRMMDKFVDMLAAWVEKGTAPPPTRSDWAELGGVTADGAIARPALAFPEVACPLGVYYNYPETTSGTTAFAAFTGQGIEPLNAKKVFVDMNRDGVWDYRETPTEAWRRLGLLQKNETLTREAYQSCVGRAADQLRNDGFFSDKTAAWYRQQAKTADLMPKAAGGPETTKEGGK